MMWWQKLKQLRPRDAAAAIASLRRYITERVPKDKLTRTVWATTFVLSLVLLLLPWLVKLDGHAHADWEQFLGRFHPLIVHLPIGLLILVPLLELAGDFEPSLREAAGFVLWLALLSCVAAVAFGYLLAYGSGDAGAGVTRHLWGGILLTIAVMICLLARPYWTHATSSNATRAYPWMLVMALLTLTWTAHQGGALTHGKNYLTQYMPQPMKRWVTVGFFSKPPAVNSFYTKHINPILDNNCVSCHGEAEVKGGLRLDSYEELMQGGEHGAAVMAGKPEQSLLVQRITLPPDHKQFMPAEGKPPLNAEQIAWIKAWIAAGASSTATTVPGVAIHESQDRPLVPVPDYSALMPELQQMQAAQGAKLVQVSKNASDGLVLNTVDAPASFGDAQLAQFEKFAPYIVEVELARTAVTNASFATLAKFTHLRAIHLEGTGVTGDGLAKLTALTQLDYVNLSGTQVTKAAVAPLSSMKNLDHLYLYNTPAEPAVAVVPDPTPAPTTEKTTP